MAEKKRRMAGARRRAVVALTQSAPRPAEHGEIDRPKHGIRDRFRDRRAGATPNVKERYRCQIRSHSSVEELCATGTTPTLWSLALLRLVAGVDHQPRMKMRRSGQVAHLVRSTEVMPSAIVAKTTWSEATEVQGQTSGTGLHNIRSRIRCPSQN